MNNNRRAKIRALVVDDSLFMRILISDMLNADPEIEVVGTAKDGREAARTIPKSRPDVITLDLQMPGWDGLRTLKYIMAEHPTPVIVLSAHSKQDAEVTFQCLEAGAVGFVLKPSGEISLDIEHVKGQLVDAVKAAFRVHVGKLQSLIARRYEIERPQVAGVPYLIIIGASTGGPQSLEALLPALPAGFPAPILIVQHVPNRFFAETLAERLNRHSEFPVKVVQDDEQIKAGIVYLAPGGFRLRVTSSRTRPATRALRSKSGLPDPPRSYFQLAEEDPSRTGPSIDDAMKSAAEVYREHCIGIILSGMGHDGLEGMRKIKQAGGRTIVQDESSLIFGMPEAVIEAGCADHVLPIAEIPKMMMAYVNPMAPMVGTVLGRSQAGGKRSPQRDPRSEGRCLKS